MAEGDDTIGDPIRPVPAWRQRYDAARQRGVPLDPKSEPVEGVTAYPTAYDPDHVLVTATPDLGQLLDVLAGAAADFGWGTDLQNIDGSALDLETAVARAERGREAHGIPTIYRVQIVRRPRSDRDDEPVPPVDAWRLIQRARARVGKDLAGVSLDHVITIDPYGIKTNPYGIKTNPYGIKTNPYGIKTNPYGLDSYDEIGGGGRQVVDYVGPAPRRVRDIAATGRRPVVAVLDTGCGTHEWLPDDIVTRHPSHDGATIGIGQPATDPETVGDVSGPFDGAIDASSGHGTFIAGIIRQICPEADIIAIRVADSQGVVLEGDFMLAIRTLVKYMSPDEGGHPVDVINLSLGYYHETPEDELFDLALADLLLAARRMGCAVVCSAGNDATDRPAFPAALWGWADAEFVVPDPQDAAPHVSVGALNPNGTMALFSNLGGWVRTYAPGASVLSAHPGFHGGAQPSTRDNRDGFTRETIDPDDFSGGYAIWSGTSFAAPYVAASLAAAIEGGLMSGTLSEPADRAAKLREAEVSVQATLAAKGPTLAS